RCAWRPTSSVSGVWVGRRSWAESERERQFRRHFATDRSTISRHLPGSFQRRSRMPAVLDMAREIPMFAASRPEERVQFERLVERCSYPAGDEILREGETDQSLRLLFAGQCEVVKCKV